MRKATSNTVLRCPGDIYKRVQKQAAEDGTSINGELVSLIRLGLEVKVRVDWELAVLRAAINERLL